MTWVVRALKWVTTPSPISDSLKEFRVPSHRTPNRSTRMSRRSLVILIGLLLATVVAGSATALIVTRSGSDEDQPHMLSSGETAILQAGGHIEAAIQWLERRAAAGSDDLSRLVREHRPEALLASAHELLADRLGVFEYQPDEEENRWIRFDPAEAVDSERPTEQTTVLLIHGLDEPGDIWDDLAPALAQHGHRVLRFDYPNNQWPADSADLLAEALQNPITESEIDSVVIVAHSMGGLIARDVLTRHATEAGWAGPRVERLITVGTPNHGSPVAMLQPIGQAREVVARLWASRSLSPSEVLSSLIDGPGEAGAALAVGSSYLTDLNARPLPEETPITILAAEATANQRQRLDDLAATAPMAGLLDDETRERLLERINAMTDLIGDGVVPLTSTVLDGVDDHRVLHGNHRSVLRTIPLLSTDPVPPAIPVILELLEKSDSENGQRRPTP